AAGLPSAFRTARAYELLGFLQRVALGASKGDVLRQEDREVLVPHRHDAAGRTVNGRDRGTPVALARDQPVAQPVADLRLPDSLLLDPLDGLADRFRPGRSAIPGSRAVQRPPVRDGRGHLIGIEISFLHAIDRPDRQTETAGELE